MHFLALGKQGWHVYDALPYLLSRSRDLEVRNQNGEAALHIALDNQQPGSGPFQKEAARVLILAGANVNAVTTSGMTCLAAGVNDIDSVRLLMAHGARADASAVFATIKNRNVGVLEALLSPGNINRQESGPRLDGELLRIDDRVEEQHALHCAATQMPRAWKDDKRSKQAHKACSDMVRVLLAHGVSPYSKFKVRTPDSSSAGTRPWMTSGDDSDVPPEGSRIRPYEQGFESCTVIHQVLRHCGTIGPFLELQYLDLEHRDSNGQTLLLAAWRNSSTFCSYAELANQDQESEPTLLIDVLLKRGTDLSARDNHGRNALHTAFHALMIGQLYTPPENFEKPLASLIGSDSSLLKQVDTMGKAPLHDALAAL